MRASSVSVVVTLREKRLLESVSRMKSAPQQLVERCRVVLMSADGRDNQDQADVLGVDRQRVRRWRRRWAKARAPLEAAEVALAAVEETRGAVEAALEAAEKAQGSGESAREAAEEARDAAENKRRRAEKDFEKLVLRVLGDAQRSGRRPTFQPEQVAAIVSLACEPPADSGLPISHWTPPELARDYDVIEIRRSWHFDMAVRLY